MAHYAELGVDNIVKRVLHIANIDCMTEGGIEKEEIGRAHLEKHHGGTWMKCSNFTSAGVGGSIAGSSITKINISNSTMTLDLKFSINNKDFFILF